jgi:hypothetical protein
MAPIKALISAEKEARLKKALHEVENGNATAHAASKALQLNYSTLKNRLAGGLSAKESHCDQQHLTMAQEYAILKWIEQISATGYAPSNRLLEAMVQKLRMKGMKSSAGAAPTEPPPLGRNYVSRFILRHTQLPGKRIQQSKRNHTVKLPDPSVLNVWYDAYRNLENNTRDAE